MNEKIVINSFSQILEIEQQDFGFFQKNRQVSQNCFRESRGRFWGEISFFLLLKIFPFFANLIKQNFEFNKKFEKFCQNCILPDPWNILEDISFFKIICFVPFSWALLAESSSEFSNLISLGLEKVQVSCPANTQHSEEKYFCRDWYFFELPLSFEQKKDLTSAENLTTGVSKLFSPCPEEHLDGKQFFWRFYKFFDTFCTLRRKKSNLV